MATSPRLIKIQTITIMMVADCKREECDFSAHSASIEPIDFWDTVNDHVTKTGHEVRVVSSQNVTEMVVIP